MIKKLPNIFIDENIPLLAESICNQANIIKFNGRELSNKDLIEGRANALIVRSTTKVDEELLQDTQIKLVATATAGTEHINLELLKEMGISFASAEGANANSVAEYVIYHILKFFLKNSLSLIVGIIGYGNIGKLVAQYCHRLGFTVLINDPPLKETGFVFPDKFNYMELDDLQKCSNVITNHVPLTKSGNHKTEYLLNKENLELVSEDMLFIHTSRGKVVCEQDLIEIAIKKRLNLVIDVWEKEPDFNSDLANKAIFATPHIAGYSYNGKLNGAKMMAKAIENIFDFTPDYSVFEVLKAKENHPSNTNIIDDKIKLLQMIESNRKFEEDNLNFKGIINLESAEKSKKFDTLRKNYQKKIEFLEL